MNRLPFIILKREFNIIFLRRNLHFYTSNLVRIIGIGPTSKLFCNKYLNEDYQLIKMLSGEQGLAREPVEDLSETSAKDEAGSGTSEQDKNLYLHLPKRLPGFQLLNIRCESNICIEHVEQANVSTSANIIDPTIQICDSITDTIQTQSENSCMLPILVTGPPSLSTRLKRLEKSKPSVLPVDLLQKVTDIVKSQHTIDRNKDSTEETRHDMGESQPKNSSQLCHNSNINSDDISTLGFVMEKDKSIDTDLQRTSLFSESKASVETTMDEDAEVTMDICIPESNTQFGSSKEQCHNGAHSEIMETSESGKEQYHEGATSEMLIMEKSDSNQATISSDENVDLSILFSGIYGVYFDEKKKF